eukprot:TRINITY_DN3085_c1_g2_i1.p1 TRINITY_DN3085_c1_g2~~TRINITY_DN3085_c1_g2_i1.p1  ORF type:complete len:236 (+),score=68.97 TRINITY_DN3085_c1_g2_i1:94-801(+)
MEAFLGGMGMEVAVPSGKGGGETPAGMRSEHAGKVFVGGLPKNGSQEDLLGWASQFGAVLECEVKLDDNGTPRGFGFVNFEDPATAQAAVANGSNNKIGDKWIDVKPHTSWAPKDHSQQDPNNPKLFIGGLPKSATEDSVRGYFSQYGTLTEVTVKMNPDGSCQGYAFITFESAASAKLVLDNYDNNMIDGQWVDCKSAVKGAGKGKGFGKGGKEMMMKGMMMKGMGKGKGWGPY